MLLAAAAAERASAAPVVTETITYYDVNGAMAAEVRASLNQRGPIDSTEKRRFDAVTHWYVNWHFNYQDRGRDCVITHVSTTVRVAITMPQLSAASAAPPALRQAFAKYVQNLLGHEKGHARIGINIAQRIEDAIRALQPEPSCDRLERAANARGHALIQEANRQDINYDAATQHGKTQGARFP